MKIIYNNQIGATETYDPSYNFTWTENLRPVNIIITKNLTDKMIEVLCTEECKSTCILHLTVTGWGGNKYMEPNVPTLDWTYNQYMKLIDLGFTEDHIVLRIDPILPTEYGLLLAESVLYKFMGTGIKRVKVSSLDMYNHVKDRMKSCGIHLPYDSFHAPIEMTKKIDELLSRYSGRYEFESCAEYGRLSVPRNVGCVSAKDIDLINPKTDVTLIGNSKQRPTCLCPSNKTQIIKTKPRRCPNSCIYCYWKD